MDQFDDSSPGITKDEYYEAINNAEQQRNLLDNSEVLTQLGYFLQGWYFDPASGEQGAYIRDKNSAILSTAGYPIFMNELQLRLSKVFSTGGPMQEEEIVERSRVFIEGFAGEVWDRRVEFGITPSSFRRLINAVDDACYYTAKKSKGAILLKLLQRNTRVIETRNFGKGKSADAQDLNIMR